MWNYGYEEDAVMNLRDSLRGRVRNQNGWGLYIDLYLEEEEETVPVFGYWSGSVPVGTEVICSIKRWAKDHKDILVTIDSVIYESGMEQAA